MAKTFAMLVGWVLVLVGILNFFQTPVFDLNLMPAHAVFHIVAGLLGIWAAKEHASGYAMWVGIVGILLAIIGFLVTREILGLIDLPGWISVVHLLLGVWGLWTYMAAKKSMSGATPASPMSGMPSGGM